MSGPLNYANIIFDTKKHKKNAVEILVRTHINFDFAWLIQQKILNEKTGDFPPMLQSCTI